MSVESVVICGIRRAGEVISAEEFRQFSGRAGRKAGLAGRVTVLCPSEDEDAAYSLVESPEPSVESRFSGVREIAFRILPCVGNAVHDEESFSRWISRSLRSHQGLAVSASWEEVIAFLNDCGCLDGNLERTALGDISARMLVRPESLWEADCRCAEVMGIPRPSDGAAILSPVLVSYLCAPLMQKRTSSAIPEDVSDRYLRELAMTGLQSEKYSSEGCLAWMLFPESECCSDGEAFQASRDFRIAMREAREDFGRIAAIISALFRARGNSTQCDEMRLWCLAVENRVPLPVARLMAELPTLGRKTAVALADVGVESIEHLRKNPELADGILSEEAVSAIISE